MTTLRNEIIFGILGSLLIIFLMVYYIWQYKSVNNAFLQNQQNLNQNKIVSTGTVNQNFSTGSGSLSVNLTVEEVKKHTTSSDCWMIINGNVYDVSNYDVNHPGGSYRIDSFCGKDATQAFDTLDGKGSHSSFANQLLNGMFLGKLNSQVDSQTVQKVKSDNAIITPKFNKNKEEDDD
jgi:cytochrome b involved in lipid metabolism